MSNALRIGEILTQINKTTEALRKPPVWVASKPPEKTCPSCQFVLTGEYLKWNGCPSCREPFFQYDAMDLPAKKSKIDETVEMFNSSAAKFERKESVAALALIEAIQKHEACSWCHGAAGYYAAGTGDEWIDCSVCGGSGRKEG